MKLKTIKILKFLGVMLMIGYSLVYASQTLAATTFKITEFDLWLNSKIAKPAKADMSGQWDAGSVFAGGWGEANLIQEEARFSGSMGLYYVKGVVSDTDVYLVMLSQGAVYYTGHLSMKKDGSFFGKTTKWVFVDSEEAKTAESYPLTFTKMK